MVFSIGKGYRSQAAKEPELPGRGRILASNHMLGLGLLTLFLLANSVLSARGANVDLLTGQVFSGMVGKARITMKLWRLSPWQQSAKGFLYLGRPPARDSLVEGYYFYDRYKRDILLLGQSDAQGNWALSEYAEAGKAPTGVFRGSFLGGKFQGRWESPDGKKFADFSVVEFNHEPRDTPEADIVSRRNEELAFESVKAKDFQKAVFYLRMSRLAGRPSNTQNWEVLFEAELEGKQDDLRRRLPSCKVDYSCAFAQGPMAYLAEQDSDFSTAKKLYQHLCLHEDAGLNLPPTFTCLVYAAFGEHSGDQEAAKEGYDLACERTKSLCSMAGGSDEEDLISAIQQRKSDVAERLLEKRLNVNARNGAALLNAVVYGDQKLVEALIQKGANPNLGDGQILETAIDNNHDEIAEYLLDRGADPNANRGEAHALNHAVAKGRIPLIEKLLAKGADVNDNDYVGAGTPLIRATEDNQLEVVQLLLDHGADPTITAKFHNPPIQATSNPQIRTILEGAIASCRTGARKCESKN